MALSTDGTLSSVSTDSQFGPLQAGFSIAVPLGYSALVGDNNAGKSAILHLVYRRLIQSLDNGYDCVCLIPPDRSFLAPTLQPGSDTLANYNANHISQVGDAPIPYDGPIGPARADLARLLVNHTDFQTQLEALQLLLDQLGLPRLILRGPQSALFAEIPSTFQGSGLRSVLPILCALTDSRLRVILVDEPESSLAPRLQKALRDLLIEHAKDRTVLVATHSHLFLQKEPLDSTLLVGRNAQGTIAVDAVGSRESLYDLVFALLGNSTEDLFFPGNYLIVEGSSDQTIVEAVLRLCDVPPGRVKVLAAGGVGNIHRTIESVSRALVPLLVNDSPYARSVVALVDQRNQETERAVAELGRNLGPRLFELDEPSLEEYLPEVIYGRAGFDRADELSRLADLKKQGSYLEVAKKKGELAAGLAGVLDADDLDAVSVLRDAARAASEGPG